MKYLYTITGDTSYQCEMVLDDYVNTDTGKLLSDEPINWYEKRYVNGQLIDMPQPEPVVPEPYTPTNNDQIVRLNYEYDSKFSNLKEAYLASQILHDTDVMAEISQEYNDLLNEYNSAIAQYAGGNDA